MAALREAPFWWEDAPLLAVGSTRPLADGVDVAVVGGGYTGLSAARTLARGGARVVVLEEESIGWGASSRNGGQVLTGLKAGPAALLARYGRTRARALFAASLQAIAFLESVIGEEGIDCGHHRCGHLHAAFKRGHVAFLQHEAELLERDFDHPVQVLGQAALGDELASPLYHGALVDERSGALHPARYVRGLAAAAERAGADLRPFTGVRAVHRAPGGFRLETAGGALRARDVLVATNGYTGAVAPALRRRVVPVGSYIVATAPLGRARAEALLPKRRVVFDSKHFLFYFRLSDDDRLLFGGRAQFTPATAASTRRAAGILRRGMLQVFPDLADVPLEFAWSGNVCFTPDMLPRHGVLDGVHHALGYSGHGVALATWLGHVEALAILGRPADSPFAELPFRALPLYGGRPWFLPAAGLWYRLRDWVG
ncbi:MAG TPA: FAD-binding oxidoreductase [Vicinamibacteria bacterium]